MFHPQPGLFIDRVVFFDEGRGELFDRPIGLWKICVQVLFCRVIVPSSRSAAQSSLNVSNMLMPPVEPR